MQVVQLVQLVVQLVQLVVQLVQPINIDIATSRWQKQKGYQLYERY